MMSKSGFALPTVLIASVVMMMVLLSGLTALTSTRATQLKAYESRITRSASEAGVAMARACLTSSNGTPQWTNSKPLKPNTDCSGNETVTCPATDVDARTANAMCFVLSRDAYRTSFEVTFTSANGKVASLNSKGVLRTLRASSGLTYSLSTSENKTFDVMSSPSGSVTFDYNGATQNWSVPAGVSSIVIEAWGAEGGEGRASSSPIYGGLGGYAKGTLAVSPGESLGVYVGGKGNSGHLGNASGGFNGGGNGATVNASYNGSGGGGASDVRKGGQALSNRQIVAAGGGGGVDGGGSYVNARLGGAGGGTTGSPTVNAGSMNPASAGGTQAAGGSGGAWSGYTVGQTGSTGQGGSATTTNPSGGGGGGYYGGGGGTWISGGGGSSYVGGVTSSTTTSGMQSGNGKVTISWGSGGTSTSTIAYSDDFGTTGAFGNVKTGSPTVAWQFYNSTSSNWFRTNNAYGYSNIAASSNPMAIASFGAADVAITEGVRSTGNAIYFRVSNANTWLRARVNLVQTTTSNGGGYYESYGCYGNRSCSEQAYGIDARNPDAAMENCAASPGGGDYNYIYEAPVWSGCDTADYYQPTTTTNTYYLILDKSMNGTITQLGSTTVGATMPNFIKVTAKGSTITTSYGSTSTAATVGNSVTDTMNQAIAVHGVGYSATSNGSVNGINSFNIVGAP